MVPSSLTSSQRAPDGSQARQAGEVDGRLGVAGAAQHAARHGAQRHDMPGPGES